MARHGFYEFIHQCEEDGLSGYEAIQKWERICAEQREAFIEEYYERPEVIEGERQADLIEMYRRER